MKTGIRCGLCIALAASLVIGGLALAALIAASPPVSAATAVSLYVVPTGGGTICSQAIPCGSIQTAINTAEAGTYNGDDVTINVAAGTYTENDTTSSSSLNSLTIAGAGASTSTVNGNQGGSVFTVNAGTVTISGLTVTNGMASHGGGIDNAGTSPSTTRRSRGTPPSLASSPPTRAATAAASTTAAP